MGLEKWEWGVWGWAQVAFPCPPARALWVQGLEHIVFGMFCPMCQRHHVRDRWSTRQWQAQRGLAEGIVGCKGCRAQPGEQLPAVLKDWVVSLAVSATRAARFCTEEHAQHWDRFVGRWVEEVPQDTRKALSYLGALRTREVC